MKFPEVEAALMVWLQNARTANFSIATALMMKADTLALQMGYTGSCCSNGWFDHFKKQKNVVSMPVHGESGSVDVVAADNCRNSRLDKLQKNYANKDIFNLDEAALFYMMLPSRTFTLKGQACSSAKQ